MSELKATPSGCLDSGPPPTSYYNKRKFSPLLALRLALRMCNYVICHFTSHFTHADLYSKCLFLHY